MFGQKKAIILNEWSLNRFLEWPKNWRFSTALRGYVCSETQAVVKPDVLIERVLTRTQMRGACDLCFVFESSSLVQRLPVPQPPLDLACLSVPSSFMFSCSLRSSHGCLPGSRCRLLNLYSPLITS